MYSKFKFSNLLFFIAIFGLISCNKEKNSIDPLLVGTWSDGNLNYSFTKDMKFGLKYKRSGTEFDKVLVDSIWGSYKVDNQRSNLYFEATQMTEKQNPNLVINKNINLPVWNYSFNTDSILNYKSNSLSGTLRKLKK